MGSDVKMAPQDRQAFMTGQQAQRQEAFASVKLAAGTLLAVLDDTQKAKAKDALPGLAAQSPGMMRHGMMGGQGTHGGMPGAGKH